MMATKLNIRFDSEILEEISSEFDLRAPNKEALRKLIFTLDGDYDPSVMQVLDLATGVGKTYLMAAFMEYLRRQGIGNVVIVTPGKTVQSKTIQNFTPGSPRYIKGSAVPPDVVTPQDYSAWVARLNGPGLLTFRDEVPMLAFIFNIQQLIAPKDADGNTHGTAQDAIRRRARRYDEKAGGLFDYLKSLDDLVVIADESHLYGATAVAFNSALKELDPAAAIGLTASADKKTDHVIYEYPLYRAIEDKYVKAPVLAFRKAGYGTDKTSEEQQLRDALQLRALKQTYYDSYTNSHHLNHINAVVFVVCSDVEHATQVADLLRTPEYFGKKEAVLQVDSNHEDELTQRRLDELDRPQSPVLAVVSVNKLKEGWDVKSIAVIVTLRAMASEVLTQQTMGRGLRLPFGKYTDVWQIDQLDIITHQSFKELLAAENVLQQFGLEEAVAEPDQAHIGVAIHKAAEIPVTGTDNAGPSSGSNLISDGVSHDFVDDGIDSSDSQSGMVLLSEGNGNGSPSVGIRTITDAAHDSELEWQTISIMRNPRFAGVTYLFPVTTVTVQQPPIELSEISNADVKQAARRVTSTGDILFRKEIVAALGKELRAEDRESAEVDSVHVDDAEACHALVKLVMDMSLVPKTERTARYVSQFLVPEFMNEVTFTGWTVKSLSSARNELLKLVQTYIAETLRETREVPSIHPKQMPGDGYMLPLGKNVLPQVETSKQFERGQVYSGWFKSLFEDESFDSFTGEYQLARLLNTSPSIQWWQRLHPQDRAFVYYNAKDRYFPDFVAQDTNDVYWIIEGKDERGRDDAKVQAKRKAAETLVRRLAAEEAYANQHWGYLIAYEQDTAQADSWEDLKSLAQPVSNVVDSKD